MFPFLEPTSRFPAELQDMEIMDGSAQGVFIASSFLAKQQLLRATKWLGKVAAGSMLRNIAFFLRKKNTGGSSFNWWFVNFRTSSHLNEAKLLPRKMPYFNYFGLLKHTRGVRYIDIDIDIDTDMYPAVNPKNSKGEFPLCIHLSKNCTNVSNCLTWRMFQSPVVTLYFFPSQRTHIFFFLNYFQGTVGLVRRGAGVWRGCLGRKQQEIFSSRNQYAHQHSTPFQH